MYTLHRCFSSCSDGGPSIFSLLIYALDDPLYATKLELKDGEAEIGLLSNLFPAIAQSGPSFPMQPFKGKKDIISISVLMIL
jgi:hypothetical protein